MKLIICVINTKRLIQLRSPFIEFMPGTDREYEKW